MIMNSIPYEYEGGKGRGDGDCVGGGDRSKERWAGVGGEPREIWPGTHWRRDRRANACVPKESILFLSSMTLLKEGQAPEDQIRDSAWGLGFSFEPFPTTQHSLVISGMEWRCET